MKDALAPVGDEGRGKLRKADVVAIPFFVKDKGFWNLLRCKLHAFCTVRLGKIFLCDRRNRCRVRIKDAHDALGSDILIVSYV